MRVDPMNDQYFSLVFSQSFGRTRSKTGHGASLHGSSIARMHTDLLQFAVV